MRRSVDAGADVDSVNERAQTATHLATQSGHLDVVRVLVARHANLALRDRDGRAPLDIAVDESYAALVLALVEAMVIDVDRDAGSLCAAATFSTDVIRVLLRRGCDLRTLRNNRRRRGTPCHIAAKRFSDAAVLELLVGDAGVDVDALDSSGRSCCHVAATRRNDVALRCFIAAGATIDLFGEFSGECTCGTGECCSPPAPMCAIATAAAGGASQPQ